MAYPYLEHDRDDGVIGRGKRRVYRFANDFGASVISGPTIGTAAYPFELCVLRFDKPGLDEQASGRWDEPENYYSEEELQARLAQIRVWPKNVRRVWKGVSWWGRHRRSG